MKPSVQISNTRLCLTHPSGETRHFPIEQLYFEGSDGERNQPRICSSLPTTLYYQIANESWLNLTTEVQDTIAEKQFLADYPIQLEILLRPDLLSELTEQVSTSEEAIAHLQNLSKKQAEEDSADIHPLLQENNWYCTAIKQQQPTGEVCCHTLWHYLLPTLYNPTSESVADSITQFIQDQTVDSFKQITQTTDPLFQDIAQTFQDLFTNAFRDLETDLDSSGRESKQVDHSSLLSVVTEFLEMEEWSYAQLSDSASDSNSTISALRLAFRGEHGQWPCYCKINQEQPTGCFYSISPIAAETEQRGAIAHFLTRANYGMILGNFELDFSDGEIRYKTGIDVEGDRITPALVQNLVYTNVLTMDQYFPGILAVLEQGISPEEAIRLVEDGAVSEEEQEQC